MNNLDSWYPKVLSVLRFVTGLMFLEHGLQKIFHFPPQPPAPGAAAAAAGAAHGLPPMIMAAGWIEIVCGILIALGLFTRAAAFIASGEMAVAYFTAHASRNPFPVNNQGDAAILYCFFFFLLVFTGPGPWSADAAMKKKI